MAQNALTYPEKNPNSSLLSPYNFFILGYELSSTLNINLRFVRLIKKTKLLISFISHLNGLSHCDRFTSGLFSTQSSLSMSLYLNFNLLKGGMRDGIKKSEREI